MEPLYRQCEIEWDKTGLPIDEANFAAWGKLKTDMGVEAASEVEMKALEIIDAVTTKIRETPAKTFAGLAVKARALRFDTSLDLQDDRPLADRDWPEKVMHQFVAELDRLAKLPADCRPQPRGRLNRAAHETQQSPAKMMRAFTAWDISHCCRNSCQCVGITVQLLVAWFAG